MATWYLSLTEQCSSGLASNYVLAWPDTLSSGNDATKLALFTAGTETDLWLVGRGTFTVTASSTTAPSPVDKTLTNNDANILYPAPSFFQACCANYLPLVPFYVSNKYTDDLTTSDILSGDTNSSFVVNQYVYNNTEYSTGTIALQSQILVANGLCSSSYGQLPSGSLVTSTCNDVGTPGQVPWSATSTVNYYNSLPNIKWEYSGGTDCFGNSIGDFTIAGNRINPNTIVSTNYDGCIEIPDCATPFTGTPTSNVITTGSTFASCASCTATTNPSETWFYNAAPCCGGPSIVVSVNFSGNSIGTASALNGVVFVGDDGFCYEIGSQTESQPTSITPVTYYTGSEDNCPACVSENPCGPTPTPTATTTPTPTFTGYTYYVQDCCWPFDVIQITSTVDLFFSVGTFYALTNGSGPEVLAGAYEVVNPTTFITTYAWNTGTDTLSGPWSSCGEAQLEGGYGPCAVTPTPTPTNTNTPTGTLQISSTPTPTPTPTVSPAITNTPTPTETPTSTSTETPTSTPSVTQTNTPTGSPAATPASTATPTPTGTLTSTPTETLTSTPSVTPTNTPTGSPGTTPASTTTPTPTETPSTTPTETPTLTPSVTPTNTPTGSPGGTPASTTTPTPTATPTNTQTSSPGVTQPATPAVTSTPTTTPTQTNTPTPSSTEPYDVYLFSACCDGSTFRFENVSGTLSEGVTYIISSSGDFDGCATVLPYSATGSLYSGSGVVFTDSGGDCTVCEGFSPCPTPTPTPTFTNTPTPSFTPTNTPTPSETGSATFTNALLTKCDDGTVLYGIVQQDVAFVGAVYLYNDDCYQFVEFSGPGGPNLGQPDFFDCSFCSLTPTPTPTPQVTPTMTPTPSSTPEACEYETFCLSTILSSLSGYSGNYSSGGTYNSRVYYTGDTTPIAFIYYTGAYWCLSDSLGGSCILEGNNPCYSSCPDISANFFSSGPCPTPTPSPINCNILDFTAYFDCDYEPFVTPTPSIPCDLVDMSVTAFPVTPTPTTPANACIVGLDFSMSGYTPIGPTPSPTVSLTPTKTVPVEGQITYTFFQEDFSCPTTKVLVDCNGNIEFYTTDDLEFSGTPINIGVSFAAYIGGSLFCLRYDRDDDNLSSNTTIDSIIGVYGNCDSCNQIATPTPSNTPTITPSPTQTPTMTPTPSTTTLELVYVFVSCNLNPQGGNQTTIVQTSPVGFGINKGQSFKDNAGNCWSYLGSFTSYSPEFVTILVNFSGNYFNFTPTVYANCLACQTAPIDQGLTPQGGGEPVSLCITYDIFPWTQNLPDSCGGYTRGQNRVIVQLRNSVTNALVAATNNVVVTFNVERNDCLGTQYETLNVTIAQAQVQGQTIFDVTTCESCPATSLPETVTKTVTGIQSITPSSITECE